jgi:FkbM family methyltransferase
MVYPVRSNMGKLIISTVKRLLAKCGLVVSRIPTVPNRPSWQRGLLTLKQYDLVPKTVFDIGVAEGTLDLYTAFPNAKFHLFDPTMESLPHMQAIARVYSATVHNFALGCENGELELKVPFEHCGSTFLEEIGEVEVLRRYTVPVRRFDEVIQDIERPALAKIDVQGFEIAVLRGMLKKLPDLDAIIVEVSTIATLRDGPEVAQVMEFFTEHGWSLVDVLSLSARPLDGILAQMDLLFVPNSSPIRADRRWQN